MIGSTGRLGAGKTLFVKGLAAGLGLDERAVASPTFVIAGRVRLCTPRRPRAPRARRFLPGRERGRARGGGPSRSGSSPARSWSSSGASASLPRCRAIASIFRSRAANFQSPEFWRPQRARTAFAGSPRALEHAMALIVQKYGGTSVARRRAHPERRAARGRDASQRATGWPSSSRRWRARRTRWWRSRKRAGGEHPGPARVRRAGLDRRAEDDRAARDGDPAARAQGALVHRRADGDAHRHDATRARASRASTRTSIRKRARRRRRRGDRRLPGRRRRAATSRRSAAAARTPRRSRSPPRSKADVCEIYTDVDGVYTTDPNLVPGGAQARAHLLRRDARDGEPRREGAADPLGEVRACSTACRCTCARPSTTARAPGWCARRT